MVGPNFGAVRSTLLRAFLRLCTLISAYVLVLKLFSAPGTRIEVGERGHELA